MKCSPVYGIMSSLHTAANKQQWCLTTDSTTHTFSCNLPVSCMVAASIAFKAVVLNGVPNEGSGASRRNTIEVFSFLTLSLSTSLAGCTAQTRGPKASIL